MKNLLPIALLVLFTTTSVFAASGQDAIKAARLRQNEAIVKHQVDAIAATWTDDVSICRGLGIQLAGKAAYRKLFEDDVGSVNEIVYQRLPSAIETSSLWPLAFETGSWEGHLGSATGPVTYPPNTPPR